MTYHRLQILPQLRQLTYLLSNDRCLFWFLFLKTISLRLQRIQLKRKSLPHKLLNSIHHLQADTY